MNLNLEYLIRQNTFKRIGLKDAYQEPSPDKSHLFKIYAQNCYQSTLTLTSTRSEYEKKVSKIVDA